MTQRQKPGEKPNSSGEYIERGLRGGAVQNPREVTIERGDPKLPPTQKFGRTWSMISIKENWPYALSFIKIMLLMPKSVSTFLSVTVSSYTHS